MVEVFFIISVVLFAWLFCFWLSNSSSWLYVSDNPNHRSLHKTPISRAGGVSIVVSILMAWLFIGVNIYVELLDHYVLCGYVLLIVISFIDDKLSLPTLIRLMTHIAAASLLLVSSRVGYTDNGVGGVDFMDLLLGVMLLAAVVWCINLYNFMDGIDGLAGGMGLIGFGCMAWFGWYSDSPSFLTMASIIAAANLGFLFHNFPPARIFMGDVGSISMGYLVALFSLWGIGSDMFDWWVPFLVFSPFFVDATATVVKRLFIGEKFWQAHRSHYYQKLVRLGWSHRRTVIYCYFLMAMAAVSTIVMRLIDSQVLNYFLWLFWLCLYVAIIIFINYSYSRASKSG